MAEEVVGFLRNVLQLDRSDYDAGLKAAGASTEAFKSKVRVAMNETERNMANSELAVKRLAATWTGAGLFRAADRYVAALKDIGGAEKLTDVERAKANVTLQKAVDKYRLLGKEVPAALLAAEQATRKVVAADAASVVQLDKIAAGMSAVGKAAITGMGEAESATKRSTAANEANLSSVDRMAAGWRRLGEMGRGRSVQADLAANRQLVAGMSAAGREASALQAQMVKASTASTLAHRGFSVLTGTIGQMTAGFTLATMGMRAVDGIVNIGRQAFETADSLVDMSAKTGLSTEWLQRLDFVADQAGGTLENFTDASFRLGVRLTSGSGSVNKAVAELSLNLAELKKARPDEQFLMVADALARVGDEQERNRLGVALFGKQYSSIASSIAQDIRKIGDSTKVMADDQVKALADAKDAWGELWKQIQITTGSVIAGLMPPSKDSPGRRRNQAIDAMSFEERREFAQRSNAGENDDAIIAEIQRRNAQMDARDLARGGTVGAASLTRQRSALDLASDVKALDAAVASLNAEQRKNIDAAFILGDEAMEQVKAQYQLTDVVIRRYSETLKANEKATKDAGKAAEEAAKNAAQFNAELVAWAGTDAIADAFKELELLEAAEAQGFKLENRTAEQIEQSRQAFEKGIKTFTRLGLEVPAKITAAFQRSAVALANNAEYIARFSPMDTSGLVGSPVVGGMVGMAPWRQSLMQAEFAQAALAADLTSGVMDVSKLNNLTVAADGTVMRFKDLNYWMEALNDNLDLLDTPGRNFDGLIRGADLLARSFDQTGLSVSRMVDSVMVGFQAGRMLRSGGVNNVVSGGIQGAAALASATSSGSKGSRIVGGMATGAAIGSAVPGIGTAAGAVVGAGIGAGIALWRAMRGVPESEKQARAAFVDWQRQVIANFDAMARAQGLVTAGMDDWDKMVAGVAAAYADTGRTVDDVHRDLKALTDATHQDAASVMAALEKITTAFTEQAQDVEILNGALSEYGFTLDELGEKQIGKTQTAEAKRLADQYRVLLDAGVDITAVHERMSGSVSKWLQDTLRTGAAIPSVMQPILANFAKQGQLIDANGLLLDEAAVASLDFTDTWVDGLDRVAVKLDQVLSRFMQLLGMPTDTLTAAQGNIDTATPKPPQTRTYNTPFGPLVVTTKHTGGYVERAHGGTFVGARALPRGMFGRLAADEMPMVLQAGEGVTNAAMTARMGGRGWVDAVNRGDVTSAIGMMSRNLPIRDPFGDMDRLIDLPNRFMPAAAAITPSTSPFGAASQGPGQQFSLTIAPGAINVVSPDAATAGQKVLDAVLDGVHNNTGGFRTKLIQKVGKGH